MIWKIYGACSLKVESEAIEGMAASQGGRCPVSKANYCTGSQHQQQTIRPSSFWARFTLIEGVGVWVVWFGEDTFVKSNCILSKVQTPPLMPDIALNQMIFKRWHWSENAISRFSVELAHPIQFLTQHSKSTKVERSCTQFVSIMCQCLSWGEKMRRKFVWKFWVNARMQGGSFLVQLLTMGSCWICPPPPRPTPPSPFLVFVCVCVCVCVFIKVTIFISRPNCVCKIAWDGQIKWKPADAINTLVQSLHSSGCVAVVSCGLYCFNSTHMGEYASLKTLANILLKM